jgi:hypothetical protein
MRSTTDIHISLDHGGWSMPACGLLGNHECIPLGQIAAADDLERMCPMCVAAVLPVDSSMNVPTGAAVPLTGLPCSRRRSNRFVRTRTPASLLTLRRVSVDECARPDGPP